MCGIAGVYFKKNFYDSFPHNEILSSLKHRGPDHQNYVIRPPVIFYHARLSIIGIGEENNQPHLSGNSLLCYNGEIFNYRELAGKYNVENCSGDVTLLHSLLKEKGTDVLKECNGFFAFARYDEDTKEFFLVRDRMGIKPLYFFQDEEKICFASEITPLLLLCGKQELNKNALYDFFQFNYIPGSQTIFRSVFSLPPAHYLYLSGNNAECRSWYEFHPLAGSEKNKKNFFINLLNQAVQDRLVADVPVGGFLSGGVDSSIVCGLASRHCKNFNTFSLGFTDQPYFDETKDAEKTAQYFKTNHLTIRISTHDALDMIPEMLRKNDQPFADSSALNIYFLCKHLTGKIKVVLGGDGADELFKGYYKHSALLWNGNPVFQAGMRFLHLILLPFSGSRNSSIGNFIRKIHKMGTLPASERQTILQLMKPEYENPAHSLLINPSHQNNVNPFFEKSPPYSFLTDEDFADLMYVLKDDMLVKTDRYSMMNSIEIRNPFLDYRVVSFALGLDKEEKISFLKRKKFLYETFQDFLPEHVLKKSKKGFEVPLSEWLFCLLTPLKIQNIFDEEKIRHQGIFNYPNLRSFLKQSITATTVKNPSLVWALWVFQDWYDRNESWIIKKSE